MKFGIDRLLEDTSAAQAARRQARGVAGASGVGDAAIWFIRLTRWRRYSDIKLSAAFGPQHGLRGDKQDNMVESADFHRSGAWHSGLQSVRRSAPADGGDDG